MPNGKLTLVISAGQSRNPEKRELERSIADSAASIDGIQVLRIPHLYDLSPTGESYAALKQIRGNIVFISWLFDRATHWVLDRNGVRGQVGQVELKQELDEDEVDHESEEDDTQERVTAGQPRPNRQIFCLDFRASNDPSEFVAEIERIAAISDWQSASDGDERPATAAKESSPLTLEMLQRFESPTNDTYLGSAGSQFDGHEPTRTLFGTSSVISIDEHPGRRWYPVIDFSRCTNCMECIDFCLFGVYGVDSLETIVVEQADNCRKGCPACSRVCPQNAIIFPQHKTPAIAGAPVDAAGLKIDLSKLFGAPESDEDASAVAARERDEQLILAGREAVGVTSGIGERLAAKKQSAKADDLDGLLDQLDSLDL